MEHRTAYDLSKSKRIEHAVEISAEMFLKSGIEAVKMTDIADQCGVGVATLYRYFGTKTVITVSAMTYLWTKLRKQYDHAFETAEFRKQSGIKQLSDMMKMYLVLFDRHSDFMKLVGEFDLMLVHEDIPKSALTEYEASIINFYPYMESAFLAGNQDGSVRTDIDFKLFYQTFGHSMLELCKKMLCGELLPSEDFSGGRAELDQLLKMGICYLRSSSAETA